MPCEEDTVMRIPHWPVLVCGGLLAAVVGQTAFAFDPTDGYIDASPVVNAGGDAGSLFGDPGYEGDGEYPAGWQPVQYAQPAPIAAGYGDPGAYGPGGPPSTWPAISPYSHNMEGYYNDAGIWSYSVNDERPRAVLGLDFLVVWGLKPGNNLIGSQISEFLPGAPTIFPAQRMSNFDDLTHYGLRVRYGWENPDESAIMLSGFFAAQNSTTLGPNTTHFNPVYGPVTAPYGIQPLASITFADDLLGPVQTLYDTSFQKTYDQEFWGADAEVRNSPFFRRSAFKMQMTYGVKYVRVSESMLIRATDSSLSYTVDNTGQITNIVDLGLPQMTTTINSQVTSNLVGPTLGVRYDLGGEKFKIWGQSKVAVAVNMDNTRISGSNAISNLDFQVSGPQSFSNSIGHTHVSPIFEQSIYGEFPVFAYIPLINRISLVNKSMFRVGFDYLLIGEMARPSTSIYYASGSPRPSSDRTWMSLKTLSFGLDWRW